MTDKLDIMTYTKDTYGDKDVNRTFPCDRDCAYEICPQCGAKVRVSTMIKCPSCGYCINCD